MGNLTNRTETVLNPANESYAYDRVDRMTSEAGSAVAYDAAGNIQSRGDTAYSYAAGTHRMTSRGGTGYDANGNVTSISGGTTRAITPTVFNLPASITQGSTALSYVYDGAHRRIKETATTAAGTTTTYYLGGYEEQTRTDGVTERRHWISSPEGAVGIHTTRSDGSTASRYWLTDHLGSVAGVVDKAGTLVQRATYASWGGKTQQANSDPKAEDRGFTGHEHLAEVNLIHMNGRVYDPGTGRFLSADPPIQDPYDGQSYNRYSYVKNNPLSFTDPSGYSWWTKWRKPIAAIAVAAIGAYYLGPLLGDYFSAAAFAAEGTEAAVAAGFAFGKAAGAVAGGFAAGGISGGNIESAVAGAVSAGAFFAAGSVADAAMVGNPGFGRGEIGRAALHAVAGCAGGATAGGSCGKQAAAGAFSELAGPIIDAGGNHIAYRVTAHAVAGGLGSMAAGGKFENGAVTGAFGYLFNEGLHGDSRPGEVGARGVAATMERYRAQGYEIVDVEVAASLPGFDYDRRYDFVTPSKETGAYIGVEVKASEIGVFRLDRNQVNFDTAVLSSPTGATVSDAPYRITGIRYEGIDLGGTFNARWQQGYLYWRLRSMGVEPERTVAPR